MEFEPTLTSSIAAAHTNRLKEWVTFFVTNEERNALLVDGIVAAESVFAGPFEVPLEECHRCCGPEPEMKFVESRTLFDQRAIWIFEKLATGWDMPPLMVRFENERLVIHDGNHRHEALRRKRSSSCPVIIWATSQSEMELLMKSDLQPLFANPL